MKLRFNIDLPDSDIRVGYVGTEGRLFHPRLSGVDLSGRSQLGYEGREYRRFYPLVLCLEALCRTNEWHLARLALAGRSPPLLYNSGVRYRTEPPGEEEWLDIPHLYRQGWGDCEDLACARVGELRHYQGIPAVPAIRHRKFGNITMVHVLTLWPNDVVEDPSKVLGMRGVYQ